MGDRDILAQAAGAVRPWNSTDSVQYRATMKLTDEWEIQACLNCPYPECFNCWDYWRTAMSNVRNDTHKNRRNA